MPLNILTPLSISKILMANSKGSKHSSQNVASVDRISLLPDSLVCHILSFLPTHYAVQTTILSKRWINLWTSLTSLHFDDELFDNYNYERNTKRFKQFVYRVLVLLKTPSLHKFFLHSVRVTDPFHFNTWVSAAVSLDVRELIIDIVLPVESLDIPATLFTCKTLSYLSLSAGIILNVPNSVSLPNLKYLSIYYDEYANDASVQKLLSGCPVLEQLCVQRDFCGQDMNMDNVFHFSISSLTLKSLELYLLSDCQPVNPRHTLEIDAPMLQYLYLQDCISCDYVIGNLSSVVKAQISICDRDGNNDENVYGDQILKLLNGLSHVKFLDLSGATTKVLSYANELVPDLQNMAKLEGHFNTSKQEWSSHQEHVPKCWLSHLATVRIADFDGSINEFMLVKFILKGAKSLERMTIIANHPETKFDLLQEITKFPKGSEICELIVW